ncbi:dnaJ homolog subfamily C member 17 [Bombus vosnesenskii]|uniref:DnaJ homolog subfamily C member 17 n=2 Tax=Pyrobombus TaxID=144703 RepID=A0A6J3K770_9HYME|nr:dnaJ homolog subfamily C member 17 [Bombus bifarius]XP_033348019.1 dnaJ homolog subfamily C member 17 [Bombus vosnesenskii]XP_050487305.1 dnaJ homolog subfamily C member 17 [Bombus huntii]XP_050487306.1 dnaJ homolog subfamily C member 17 [Bombus huntii]XP_050487307.1 dnaJ homolog subfamily C member 17 [Bombus huntii]
MDLYELIGIERTASVQEIKKAYRKKALCCHPDKNPDNPKAAELFHELSRALEILIDTSARAAYDKVINAKYQQKLRAKEFDLKRKKLKEDLEAREFAEKSLNTDNEKLQAEIERLRKEGSKQVQEEIALMNRHIEKQSKVVYKESETNSDSYRLKVKWKSHKDQTNNDGYDYNTLYRIFSKYGKIIALVISSTREGRALVEYQKRSDAEMALNYEIGLAQYPLKLQKLWDKEEKSNISATETAYNDGNFTKHMVDQSMFDIEQFEHSVLNNLKKAEERKRSIGKQDTMEST